MRVAQTATRRPDQVHRMDAGWSPEALNIRCVVNLVTDPNSAKYDVAR